MFAQGFAVPARSFFFGSHFLHIIYKSLRLRLVSHHADSGIYLSSMSQPESMCLQSREYSRGPGICVGVICQKTAIPLLLLCFVLVSLPQVVYKFSTSSKTFVKILFSLSPRSPSVKQSQTDLYYESQSPKLPTPPSQEHTLYIQVVKQEKLCSWLKKKITVLNINLQLTELELLAKAGVFKLFKIRNIIV